MLLICEELDGVEVSSLCLGLVMFNTIVLEWSLIALLNFLFSLSSLWS